MFCIILPMPFVIRQIDAELLLPPKAVTFNQASILSSASLSVMAR